MRGQEVEVSYTHKYVEAVGAMFDERRVEIARVEVEAEARAQDAAEVEAKLQGVKSSDFSKPDTIK